jgi:hypothetical protein
VRFIREPLCDLKTALLVATNTPEIPWELLHDGTDFLGLRYEMGRSLRARGPEWRPRGKNEKWQCLIIANPKGDLPTASEEAATVKDSLEGKGIVCDDLFEEDATFENVLHALNGAQYDIIHYSGHIGREPESGEYGFVLCDDQFFTASAIKTHVRTPAIAFLNGCNSGAVVQGLTEAFLATGAQMVIGSLYATPSRGAAAFAKKFYADFLKGTSAGESMRQARLHVKDLENCGASWACFVMYGDPRFSLELKTDELGDWLAGAGIGRAEFDASAIKVLQQALAYGAVAGGVSTAIYFAALLEGADPFLRSRLELHGVLELLEGAFKAALRESECTSVGPVGSDAGANKDATGVIEASPHVADILRRAKQLCGARGLPTITEQGLVSAFAREPAGGAWEILRRLKVKPADLDPWRDATASMTISSVGGLRPSMCTARAWAVLMDAAQLGAHSGSNGVSAIHLFRALVSVEGGLAGGALAGLGIQVASRPDIAPDPSVSLVYKESGESVACSHNVADIFARSQRRAEAEDRAVEEKDLLHALVENGGGASGVWLQRHGIPPRLLISRLFLEGGALDTGRFDESGQKVLDEMFEFARQRGFKRIGRRHLLYGLLSVSAFCGEEFRKQGCDSEMLAEALYAVMTPGLDPSLPDVPRWSSMSTGLLGVLCNAEAEADAEASKTISDRNLLNAWCRDGGGDAGRFLVENGVKVRKLCK